MRLGCNNTGGVKLAITASVALGDLHMHYKGYTNAVTAITQETNTVINTLTTNAFITQNTQNVVLVNGEINVTNTSTITFQFASTTGGQTSTVYTTGTNISYLKFA